MTARPPPETPTDRQPIHWLGDATQDCDIWELTHRYDRGRLAILGSPTALYLIMDDGTQVRVPVGWWIGDDDGKPFASSAQPPAPRSAPETRPSREEVERAVDALLSAKYAETHDGSPDNVADLADARAALLSLLGFEVKP